MSLLPFWVSCKYPVFSRHFWSFERLFLGVLDVLISAKCELFKNIFAFDYYALCLLEQVHLYFLPRYNHAKISYTFATQKVAYLVANGIVSGTYCLLLHNLPKKANQQSSVTFILVGCTYFLSLLLAAHIWIVSYFKIKRCTQDLFSIN